MNSDQTETSREGDENEQVERRTTVVSSPFSLCELSSSPSSGSLTAIAAPLDSEDEDSMVAATAAEVVRRRDEPSSLVVISSKITHSSISKRYLVYGFCLWILEVICVLLLKRVGVVTPDFRLDEAVKQSVLEQGILSRLEENYNLLSKLANQSIPLAYWKEADKRPGYQLAQEGATAKYPVVMVPGFVTSGLEVWGGKECAKKHFRQRLWAALGGARSFLMERDCWSEHMRLDPITGMDPEGIRLRAAAGFEAADYFMPSYWVWGKLIENLADVGYTPSTMTMEPYDWRLSFPLLEERDGYLTRLKASVESMHKTTGRKVVLTAHSMGSLLVHHFFAWVTTPEKRGGGGGGKDWVDKHIHAYINIAGSHLGVSKAASALLSGEMSDTIMLGTMGSMVEQFYGRRLRRDLWNTWGSLWTMLPKGGNALWGPGADMCQSRSAEDRLCPEPASRLSPLIAVTRDVDDVLENVTERDGDPINMTLIEFHSRSEHSTEETLAFLSNYGGGFGPDLSSSRHISLFGEEKPSERTWHDPTRTPLPNAPDMQIYCLYGTGVETERAYYYGINEQSSNLTDTPAALNVTYNDLSNNVKYGVRYADGDGSVPLISLGYICADAWNRPSSGLNPSKSPVYTREYLHREQFTVDDPMRGGPYSADHVDILGNVDMTEDFLRIVTDFHTEKVKEDRIVSDIRTIAAKINAHPGGGVFKKKWQLFSH